MRRFLIVLACLAATAGCRFMQEDTSCQFNIISSTVVAAYCGHNAGDHEAFDALIAWRGEPGWFLRGGSSDNGGSRRFGAWTNGRVSQHATYGNVRLAFDADFDAGTVATGGVTVPLTHVNTILIDQAGGAVRSMSRTWIEPHLPIGGDVNLALAQRSRELREFLRCEVPMPARSPNVAPVAIITVCEKLASGHF